jgi:hypothetical protein
VASNLEEPGKGQQMAEQSMFLPQGAAPGHRNCHPFDPKSTCPGRAHGGRRFSEIEE